MWLKKEGINIWLWVSTKVKTHYSLSYRKSEARASDFFTAYQQYIRVMNNTIVDEQLT